MPGLLLAGDAAGFVDPMTGDGLRLALRGAELAADAAAAALAHSSEPAHTRLADARARDLGRKLTVNRLLRRLTGSPRAIDVAGLGASLAPAVLERVIRYAGDLHTA
jgi:flavin-dependent dehydrogenase